jgi:hypothetical protein
VEKLTMVSKPKDYDQAAQLLRDLQGIARREDDIAAFTARVCELRTRYAKRLSRAAHDGRLLSDLQHKILASDRHYINWSRPV